MTLGMLNRIDEIRGFATLPLEERLKCAGYLVFTQPLVRPLCSEQLDEEYVWVVHLSLTCLCGPCQ